MGHIDTMKSAPAGFVHPTLGAVSLRVNPRSRRLTARWRGGSLCVTVPPGMDGADIRKAIDSLVPRLERLRTTLAYAEGQRIVCPGVEFLITRQSYAPSRIIATPSLPLTVVAVGAEVDMGNATRAVSRILCGCASSLGGRLLLPRAREIAARLGCHPAGWRVGRGHRVLGTCDATGMITLSSLLVFLPQELQDFVICHELAHLLEMNHSARFHEVLDGYLGGREAELHRCLRSFTWPVLR